MGSPYAFQLYGFADMRLDGVYVIQHGNEYLTHSDGHYFHTYWKRCQRYDERALFMYGIACSVSTVHCNMCGQASHACSAHDKVTRCRRKLKNKKVVLAVYSARLGHIQLLAAVHWHRTFSRAGG